MYFINLSANLYFYKHVRAIGISLLPWTGALRIMYLAGGLVAVPPEAEQNKRLQLRILSGIRFLTCLDGLKCLPDPLGTATRDSNHTRAYQSRPAIRSW